MIRATNISMLKDSELICIDSELGIFNGYILESAEYESGIMTLIVSHDHEFYEEDYINVEYEESNGNIIYPDIYLLDQ